MRASASSAGNARKKSPDSAIAASGSTRRGGAEPAERLDRVEADVDVRIVERGEQRVDRRRRRCCVPSASAAWIRRSASGWLQQIDQRGRHVDAGQRQQLQRAAQHAEIAVPVAQRRRPARRRAPDRAVPASACTAARRTCQSSSPIAAGSGPRPSTGSAPRSRSIARSRAAGSPLRSALGELMLALEPRGHVLDGHDQADRAVRPRAAPPTSTRCCMWSKRGDGRRRRRESGSGGTPARAPSAPPVSQRLLDDRRAGRAPRGRARPR